MSGRGEALAAFLPQSSHCYSLRSSLILICFTESRADFTGSETEPLAHVLRVQRLSAGQPQSRLLLTPALLAAGPGSLQVPAGTLVRVTLGANHLHQPPRDRDPKEGPLSSAGAAVLVWTLVTLLPIVQGVTTERNTVVDGCLCPGQLLAPRAVGAEAEKGRNLPAERVSPWGINVDETFFS